MLTAKAITFDIDWAPDFMVEECMTICAKAGVPASFYATHPSPILREIERDSRFELGIHPNFLPGSTHGTNHGDVLAYCLDLVPGATSMRTHGLYQSTQLYSEVTRSFPQIRVDASLFLPGHRGLQAVDFHVYGKVLRRLPFYWEDDIFADEPDCDCSLPPITCEGLNIFAFHPVHVGLNSERIDRYVRLKLIAPVSSWDAAFIAESVNKTAGIRTFLEALTKVAPASEFMTLTGMADAS